MTGYRVGTTPSADLELDTYATVGSRLVKMLCGVRIETGTWQITVNDLSAVVLEPLISTPMNSIRTATMLK